MIDRRGFFGITGGALAGGAAAAAPALASLARDDRGAGPAVTTTGTLHADVHVRPGIPTLLFDVVETFTQRLAMASGGRFVLRPVSMPHGSSSTPGSAIEVGFEDDFIDRHPALAVLGGFMHQDVSFEYYNVGVPRFLDSWLRAGGGQAVWDEIAALDGVKPVLIGQNARQSVLWSRLPLDEMAPEVMHENRPYWVRYQNLRLAVPGVGRLGLRILSIPVIEVPSSEVLEAIREERVDAIELPDFATAILLDGSLQGSQHWTWPSFNRGGRAIALRIPVAQWRGLGEADQTLIELVAADTFAAMLAVHNAHHKQFMELLRIEGRNDDLADSLVRDVEFQVAEYLRFHQDPLTHRAIRSLPMNETRLVGSRGGCLGVYPGGQAHFEACWPGRSRKDL